MGGRWPDFPPRRSIERLQDDVTGWVRLTVRRAGTPLRFAVLRSYLIPDTVSVSYEDGILYLASATSTRARPTASKVR